MESRLKSLPWNRLRIAAIVTGVVVMALAVFGHYFGIGESGRMGVTRWLGLLVGLGVLVSGVLGAKLADAYRTTALILLNTMLAIVAVELLSALGLVVVGRLSGKEAVFRARENLGASGSSYYETRPWAEAYWREFQLARHNRYHPFYLWRLRPFAGRLIRVDSAGLRETPGAQCTGGAYRVFVFGGSTVWGLGSPDAGSIPAHLQTLLAERLRRPVCVTNFGQLGFTTAQDLVQFESELRAGNVPELALFYGGVNDITTTYVYGRTGIHWDLRTIAAALEGKSQPRDPGLIGAVRQSNLYRLAVNLVRIGPKLKITERHRRRFESDSFADAVVAAFARHHQQAEVLGRGYGFKVAFFWQPSVAAGAKPLTDEEQRALDREEYAGFAARVYARARIRLTGQPGLYYLGDVFATERGLVYIDSHHLTPEANRAVAHAIVERIQHDLPDAVSLSHRETPRR